MKALSNLVAICFFAIMLGALCLTIATAILKGFEKATMQTLQNIHADIVIQSPGNDIDIAAIAPILEKEFPMIAAWAPRAAATAIIERTTATYNQHGIVTLQAIDPIKEEQTTQLAKTIIQPTNASCVDCMYDNRIMIGKTLAQELHVAIGDQLTLYYTADALEPADHIAMASKKLTIGGIFSTGIAEYDANVLWGTCDLYHSLFDQGISSVGIRLHLHANKEAVCAALQTRFGINAASWHDLYPALMSALQLEQRVMLIVLFFIVFLASLTMVATLMLHIEHKRTDIALLQSMGMPQRTVMWVFIIVGLLIACSATLCGMACGWLASFIINYSQCISLPDAYYISYVPAFIEPSLFCWLFLFACLISAAAVWYAARNIYCMSISTVLRGETS